MEVDDLLKLYQNDSFFQLIQNQVQAAQSAQPHVHIKGLVGSLDAVMAAAMYKQKPHLDIYVLNDREEAAYFQNDLQYLLKEVDVLYYPPSYKRPYQYEEIDNASVLQRGEILNKLNTPNPGPLQIVTYPEALF